MEFRDPPRRAPVENLLPMINVVFLLLIFFLIAAELAPPTPFAITPPETTAAETTATEAVPGRDLVLWLGPEGEMAFGDARGAAALAALAQARAACIADCARLTLRADAAVGAEDLAKLMPQLAGLGFAQLSLVASGR